MTRWEPPRCTCSLPRAGTSQKRRMWPMHALARTAQRLALLSTAMEARLLLPVIAVVAKPAAKATAFG